MTSSFGKNLLRSVTGSLGRFVAIAAIVALGCGFYAGLRMTCPDMLLSADAYYDDSDLCDVRVVAPLGLEEADVEALRAVEGVSAVMPAYETDVMATMGGEQYAVRVHSLAEEGSPELNRLELAEGRLPERADECVISADRVMGSPVGVGDAVTLTECTQELDDTLVTRTFTVVGFAHAPYYVASTAMGSTSLGSGSIQQFMYVLPGAFCEDVPYAEAFALVEGAKDEFSGDEAYQRLVDAACANAEGVSVERAPGSLARFRAQTQAALDEARAEYAAERDRAYAELGDAQAQLDEAAATIEASEARIAQGQADYDAGTAELARQRAAVTEQLDAAEAQIDAQQEQSAGVEGAEVYLGGARAELAGRRAQAIAQFAAAEQALSQAADQLEDARAQLAEGKEAYERNLARYEESRAEAESQLASAEDEINRSQEALDGLAEDDAAWLVMDRAKLTGAVSFESDAHRIDSIAQVFPFIFFLVAALVALTTMTRMVEEERVLIGTFKALGYSRARITSKYLVYAAAASVTGSVAGIALMSQVLPAVIMEAYSIIYAVPPAALPIDAPISLAAAGLGVGVTLLATFAAAAATLREQPAQLMLPRAPKAGKRILIERIRPLWRRASFSWKVTLRNLFRYKKRFVMTVIGIAGCTALLLTGLGLQDSINDIIDKQFGEIVSYNVVVTADAAADEDVLDEVGEHVGVSALAQEEPMVARTQAGADVRMTMVVPEDPDAFTDLWALRERAGHAPVALDGESVVVTEKLASTLGIGVGDELVLFEQDVMGNAAGAGRALKVTGVAENYIANYAFVGEEAYGTVFGRSPEYRTLFGTVGSSASAHEAFAAAARAVDGVKTVTFNDETIDTYRTMLKSVNMVVVVLVVAAAALAFIVLYNLTNINITERVREIATLKVLGFTRREVDLYIYRETMLLTVIGCVAGLLLGIVLEGFVVVTAEVDYVMFGREIHAASFAAAFALTLAFAAFVMLVMRGKLAKVNMVESLKSNE
ncbi:FtsX-like permease family protein [Adlercreutzia sp. ZJ242]|uniref:FtsX-like permease family protein n=1 Tax=Adlercreutzia sp. ZJ242 TaxID=2709409 RepID=UPI0013EBFC86|nr:FtsX-like permease family protein [Adlercreutzia sp. ZJ242]